MSKIRFLFISVLFVLVSCGGSKAEVKNEEQSQDSVSASTETISEEVIITAQKTDSTLFLLARDEYKTYSDHFVYLSDEEYFRTDFGRGSHLDDVISIGVFDNDEYIGLLDSLKLNEKWLCISFFERETDLESTIFEGKTTSYSSNDVIELIPLTLLDVNKEKRRIDIALRGNFDKSSFNMIDYKYVSGMEQRRTVESIQKYVQQANVIPPRPMSTDTLLLTNIYKLADNFVVAKYRTLAVSDSDGDYGNECFFVLINNIVTNWFAGMSCDYEVFELQNQKYLYVTTYTYATGRYNLFKLEGDDLKEIYKSVLFYD